MDNKSELFDLEREKRELDSFLSTIAEDEALAPPATKGIVLSKEALSSLSENKSTFEASQQEPSELKLEQPAVKTDAGPAKPSVRKDKAYATSVNEFIPKFADAAPLGLGKKSDSVQDSISSLLSLDEAKKPETSSRITVTQTVKPLESFKTMTRFDGTTKSESRVLADVKPLDVKPLAEVKKTPPEVEADKKIDTASPYDFAPRKSFGKGKWIGLSIILIIVLLAGYFWLSSKSLVPGFRSLFKIDWSAGSSSSVKGINLLNVRQRLVYNAVLGKSIRVVEGVAENSSSSPVSKIKILANLYGADGSLLASMESFGGSILIDSKLESLDEAGLISELNKGITSEDKIPPNGQIPFMVIFTKELSGVHRLSVLPTDYVTN
ncbi:MAG: DUF3426 domain-containing protein [Deltaproteobacteria bacterium]